MIPRDRQDACFVLGIVFVGCTLGILFTLIGSEPSFVRPAAIAIAAVVIVMIRILSSSQQ